MGAVTVIAVPRSRRTTPPRSTQIDDAPWFRFGAVADHLGISRSSLMKELVLWYIRYPGARLPRRPTQSEIDAIEQAAAARVDDERQEG